MELKKVSAVLTHGTSKDCFPVGLTTTPFLKRPMQWVIDFAAENGFESLEIVLERQDNCYGLNLSQSGGRRILKRLLSECNIKISSLSFYDDLLDKGKGKENTGFLKDLIDIAADLDLSTVCTLGGYPLGNKSRMETIDDVLPGVLNPLVEYAGQRNVRIALENYFETNLQLPEHWLRVFEVLPPQNLGLNYDPSHLCWQDIDYIKPLEEFKDRIFHIHLKDCFVRTGLSGYLSSFLNRDKQYTLPGRGCIDWERFVQKLLEVDYCGAASIEHEDRGVGVEEGFIQGLSFIQQTLEQLGKK